MRCTFVGEGAKSKKKCEAIVYCQVLKSQEVTLTRMWENA